MYLLLVFSGLADRQSPTDGDENVAFIASVGSTQRVISRSSNRCRPFAPATNSSVRKKCHIPLRKLGPLNSSALASARNGTATISAMAAKEHPNEIPARATRR